MVDVPALHPSEGAIAKEWCGRKRGLVVELIESGDCEHPDNPLVCLKIVGGDGTLFETSSWLKEAGGTWYAWFLASDIRAGTVSDPEFSLSVDAKISGCPPRIPDDPSKLYGGDVLVYCPEQEVYFDEKRYKGSVAS